MVPQSAGHYLYISPAGESLTSKQEARRSAGRPPPAATADGAENMSENANANVNATPIFKGAKASEKAAGLGGSASGKRGLSSRRERRSTALAETEASIMRLVASIPIQSV